MSTPIVRLMHYDPRWRQEFQQTKSSLLHSCMGWVCAVEHIGSTAIEGLIAEPIIDVMAQVQSDDSTNAVSVASDLIQGMNFRVVDQHAWFPDAAVLEKPRYGPATHRVFLTAPNRTAWHDSLKIRERLRQDRELALRFEATKLARWRHGEGDPEQYRSDKSIFFTHLLDQIEQD